MELKLFDIAKFWPIIWTLGLSTEGVLNIPESTSASQGRKMHDTSFDTQVLAVIYLLFYCNAHDTRLVMNCNCNSNSKKVSLKAIIKTK